MDDLIYEVKDVIQMMEQTSTLFYRQKKQEGLQLLDQTLMHLIQLITNISNIKDSNKVLIDEKKFNMTLGQAMSAIENGDVILLSDLFIFELKPLLEQFNQNIIRFDTGAGENELL